MCVCVCVCFCGHNLMTESVVSTFFASNRRHQVMSKIFFTPKAFSIKKVFCKLQFFLPTNNTNKQVFRSIFLLLRPPTNSSLAKRTCQPLICPFRFFSRAQSEGKQKRSQRDNGGGHKKLFLRKERLNGQANF